MRSNDAYLLDMLLAARKIKKFAYGLTLEMLKDSEIHQSAIIREFQVIGDAAKQVSDDVKSAHPEIAWSAIAGMRNRLVHEYFRVNYEILWDAIENDISPLIAQLEVIVPPQEHE
jgi:uncharacterized protein with HEPN domain